MINLHVSTSPRHLRVTPTMVDDFLIDPVLGAKVIMGYEADVFQKIRLRNSFRSTEKLQYDESH